MSEQEIVELLREKLSIEVESKELAGWVSIKLKYENCIISEDGFYKDN